jgi:hypothetical protein
LLSKALSVTLKYLFNSHGAAKSGLRAGRGSFDEDVDGSFAIAGREWDGEGFLVGVRFFTGELAVNPDLGFAGDVAEIELAAGLLDAGAQRELGAIDREAAATERRQAAARLDAGAPRSFMEREHNNRKELVICFIGFDWERWD